MHTDYGFTYGFFYCKAAGLEAAGFTSLHVEKSE